MLSPKQIEDLEFIADKMSVMSVQDITKNVDGFVNHMMRLNISKKEDCSNSVLMVVPGANKLTPDSKNVFIRLDPWLENREEMANQIIAKVSGKQGKIIGALFDVEEELGENDKKRLIYAFYSPDKPAVIIPEPKKKEEDEGEDDSLTNYSFDEPEETDEPEEEEVLIPYLDDADETQYEEMLEMIRKILIEYFEEEYPSFKVYAMALHFRQIGKTKDGKLYRRQPHIHCLLVQKEKRITFKENAKIN